MKEDPTPLKDLLQLRVEYVRSLGIAPARKKNHELELELRKKALLVALNGSKTNTCYGLLTSKSYLRSELALRLAELSAQHLNCSIGLVVVDLGNGKVRLSLRTSGAVNVAEICMQMGGGGHPKAAGAIVSKRTFYHYWVLRKGFFLLSS
jgi:nanoRNase/pAp phosphatase (c-di-AMP/oligoRNAs hydrolase)